VAQVETTPLKPSSQTAAVSAALRQASVTAGVPPMPPLPPPPLLSSAQPNAVTAKDRPRIIIKLRSISTSSK
jgi:hypothetical protein